MWSKINLVEHNYIFLIGNLMETCSIVAGNKTCDSRSTHDLVIIRSFYALLAKTS
jgi:hypothetical protein